MERAQGEHFHATGPLSALRTMLRAVSVHFLDATDNVLCLEDGTSQIKGSVGIVVTEPVQIIDCVVELRGESLTNPLETADLPDSLSRVPIQSWSGVSRNREVRDGFTHLHIRYRREFDRGGGLLLGNNGRVPPLPYRVLGSKRQPTMVREYFRFKMSRPVSEPWEGNGNGNGFVNYWLTVRVRYARTTQSWSSLLASKDTWRSLVTEYSTATMPVTFRNAFSLETLDPANPYLQGVEPDSAEKEEVVGTTGGSLIACRLHLPYTGFVHGEVVPVAVYIHNRSSRTIRSASLRFVQEITMVSRKLPDCPLKKVEDMSRLELEPVPPNANWCRLAVGLRVPLKCRTDGSFPNNPLISVRFFIRLKLKYWPSNTMLCDVPCHVGTSRTRSRADSVPTPSVNNDPKLYIFPSNLREIIPPNELPFTLMEPEDG